MRVLLTSAAGYIGLHLRPLLQEAGHYVVPVYRWPDAPHKRHYDGPFEWAWFADLAKGFGDLESEAPPDAVVHLAGRADIRLQPNPDGADLPPVQGLCDGAAIRAANHDTAVTVVSYCLRHDVRHMIFASSQAVYGMPDGPLTETSHTAPLEAYAWNKLQAEMLLRQMIGAASGIRTAVTILRLPGIYGGERQTGCVWNMLRSLLREETVRVESKFPLPFDCLHIDDACAAFLAALRHPPGHGVCETYNIATGEPCSLDLLAQLIAGLRPGGQWVPNKIAQPIVTMMVAKARERLGWQAWPRVERLLQVLATVGVTE